MSPAEPSRTRALSVAALTVLLAAWPRTAVAADEDPWALLSAVRARLAAGPRVADFAQTYLPAGFSSGETESGTIAFDLPERVRWDYADPYPRSYLVSGVVVYAWSEGDDVGRRLELASAEARHLDLLRLDSLELARRYVAERVAEVSGEGVEVVLTPLSPDSDIIEATIALGALGELAGLSYRDAEGNVTRFDFSATRPLEDAARLVPPDLEWQEP